MDTWENQPSNYEKYLGFVYLIQAPSGMKYIGKKSFWVNPKDTRVSARKGSRRWVETDWRKYWGSSNKLLEDRERNPVGWSRRMLWLCNSKFEMAYCELQEQIQRDVLFDDKYYNSMVAVKLSKVPVDFAPVRLF